ncbi:hypothetical protein GCM10027020_31070 [Nocardioides salsibiostraticola]
MAKLNKFSKAKDKHDFKDPDRVTGANLGPRFIVALTLMIAGIAWMAYYYIGVRPADFTADAGKPAFMADLEDWNYLIGFGLLFVGMIVAAHPSTPLGRGRGVTVGMMGCFLLGLAWICTFYIFVQDLSAIPVFNDLGQKNLFVGIGLMGVGFTYATRWE